MKIKPRRMKVITNMYKIPVGKPVGRPAYTVGEIILR
jgi:hypothetical protein